MTETLHQRLLEDMQLAGLAESTQKNYLAVIRQIGDHFSTPPEFLTERQVERYIRHLLDERKVARGTFQNDFHGLRFFDLNTLAVDWHLFVKKSQATAPKTFAARPQCHRMPRSDSGCPEPAENSCYHFS